MNFKRIMRVIFIILIILNCILIFNFSAEKSEESDLTSGRIVNAIVERYSETNNLSEQEKETLKEKIVKPVRKTAHFTVYMSLGILLYLCAKTFEIEEKKRIVTSVSLAFLYASSDEIHQLFVSGRSGQFTDVCIDTLGAGFGILLVYLMYKIGKIMEKTTNLHKVKTNV